MLERKKHILTIIFVMFMAVLVLNTQTPVLADECIVISGNNENAQSYARWASPIESYLFNEGDKLIKVQSDYNYEGILVEYYDMNYKLLSNKVIPVELPLFGGVYANDDNYYIVSGQNNPDESAGVECFRITKYDKSWKRIDSVGLFDCNTTVPFRAGSLRFVESGKWLLIRTAHEMYAADDGLNHQANVTIQLNMETMEITDSFTSVMNSGYGYVSHSFNQFIQVENNNIVAVDHGDAHPRSIVLIKYGTDISDGTFVPSYYDNGCEVIDVLALPGAIGENATGASIGGFEIASDYYLVAGNSVVQDEQNLQRTTRNIFVSAVSKTSGEVTTNWITNYAEGEESTTTPHLVKISSDQYVLLWTREENIYYTLINGAGKTQGQIYSLEGSLSDCVPVIVNGKLIWYTWRNEIITFYEIKLSELSVSNVTKVDTGHQYSDEGVADGYVKLRCEICGKMETARIADSVSVWWNEGDGDSYSALIDDNINVNDTIYYWWSLSSCDELADEVIIENLSTDIIEHKRELYGMGSFTAKKEGIATITFAPKYNPEAKETYVFKVFKEGFIPISYISLNMNNAYLWVGENLQLEVLVNPENAMDKSVSFKSSDTSVATVSDSGLITAKGEGSAEIIVVANDGSGEEDVCYVTVLHSDNSDITDDTIGDGTGDTTDKPTEDGTEDSTDSPTEGGTGDTTDKPTGEEENVPSEDGVIQINGLAQAANGNWYKYVNGKVDTKFTSLYCDANVGWWLVRDGQVAFDYTGLYCDTTYGWWLIRNGAVCFDYTGLYCDATYGWWLIGGGAVAFDYTGLWCDPTYGWWLVGGGAVCFDYTGLWGDPTYGWWLIGNGAVAFNYNGLWGDPTYGWWLINGGTIPFGYTGLYYDATYGWWYIEGGALGFHYTGEIYYNGTPYYVIGGQLV